MSDAVVWRHRKPGEAEGQETWQATVSGILLTVRHAVTREGGQFWFQADPGAVHDTYSSLWCYYPGMRSWPTVEMAQEAAVTFARLRKDMVT